MISNEISEIDDPHYFQMRCFLEEGIAQKDIAAKLGISTGQCSKLKKKWGLQSVREKEKHARETFRNTEELGNIQEIIHDRENEISNTPTQEIDYENTKIDMEFLEHYLIKLAASEAEPNPQTAARLESFIKNKDAFISERSEHALPLPIDQLIEEANEFVNNVLNRTNQSTPLPQ